MVVRLALFAIPLPLVCVVAAQVIEFESNGMKYQTLTRSGVTVMFAHMPSHVREYTIIQVAVSNGSPGPYVIRPEDFSFVRHDGVVRAASARHVVESLIDKGGRGDVIRLVSTYEAALYGMSRIRSTNGYEQRRQAALAEVSSTKLKAAAAASAIALVHTKLNAGQSTDGAVFFPTDGKPLGPGHLVLRNAAGDFEFNME
ncbi:MAG: hypothetical protein HYR60_05605 [Acidobacteria bacterium]|nr:hypothetical protein [Acidobacteriota bacterium]